MDVILILIKLIIFTLHILTLIIAFIAGLDIH